MQVSGQIPYSDEFKIDAVAQVTQPVYSVKKLAERLGMLPVDDRPLSALGRQPKMMMEQLAVLVPPV